MVVPGGHDGRAPEQALHPRVGAVVAVLGVKLLEAARHESTAAVIGVDRVAREDEDVGPAAREGVEHRPAVRRAAVSAGAEVAAPGDPHRRHRVGGGRGDELAADHGRRALQAVVMAPAGDEPLQDAHDPPVGAGDEGHGSRCRQRGGWIERQPQHGLARSPGPDVGRGRGHIADRDEERRVLRRRVTARGVGGHQQADDDDDDGGQPRAHYRPASPSREIGGHGGGDTAGRGPTLYR
jgi:hypothetical protein